MHLASLQSTPLSIAQKKADEFAFKTQLDRPISELSLLRRSLLMAEMSFITCLTPSETNIAAGMIGFSDGKIFDSENARAHWFQNEHDSVVVFRSVASGDFQKMKSVMGTASILAETVGKIHSGFKSMADEIWPEIETGLEKNTHPTWFCGHSIGGALASISAGRCLLSQLKSEPEELVTFGSPRIGCGRYVHHAKIRHYRWVNNNDIVARYPPRLASFRHSGIEMYLDRNGRLRDLEGWKRYKDRFLGELSALRSLQVDSFADHSITHYIDRIFDLVRAEESKESN